jgi:galactokinase/mevalonate kinase-like predicted kinase
MSTPATATSSAAAAAATAATAIAIATTTPEVPKPSAGASTPVLSPEKQLFAAQLASFCGGDGRGIEIACCSDLPAGSGMGGSSVVAAAALRAVAHLFGISVSQEELTHLVSQVEQGGLNRQRPCALLIAPFFRTIYMM